MASAPFPTAAAHLAQRLAEAQWHAGTTEDEYLANLRRAIQHPRAHLAVYERRGGRIAATLTDTALVIPADRCAEHALPLLFVVYSGDRGMIVTGYQVSSVSQISLPGAVQWLR